MSSERMTVNDLARVLAEHQARGRGGDDVFLRLAGLSDGAHAEMDQTNWALYQFAPNNEDPQFVILYGKPMSEEEL